MKGEEKKQGKVTLVSRNYNIFTKSRSNEK